RNKAAIVANSKVRQFDISYAKLRGNLARLNIEHGDVSARWRERREPMFCGSTCLTEDCKFTANLNPRWLWTQPSGIQSFAWTPQVICKIHLTMPPSLPDSVTTG